jgi:hypothetical protein
MKRFLSILFLHLCVAVPADANDQDPWIIAQKFDIVGKGESRGCVPFAFDLSSRFIFTRTEANIVIFDWTLPMGKQGRHAMVVFRDPAGRLWAMDNLRDKPLWVKGDQPQDWIAQFMPNARTRLVSNIPNAYAKNELALGNPNPSAYQDAASAPRSAKKPLE